MLCACLIFQIRRMHPADDAPCSQPNGVLTRSINFEDSHSRHVLRSFPYLVSVDPVCISAIQIEINVSSAS
jgi:hypothetical protein